MTGKEGWVQLKYDVTETGSVDNVVVLKSQPRRLFNQAAKRPYLSGSTNLRLSTGNPNAVVVW